MSTQPVPAGVELVRQRLKDLPREQTLADRDPTLRRYIFNPFHEQRLDSLLARHSGFFVVPAGVIFAIEAQRYRDVNYAAVGLSELLDASESVNQPSEKTFTRQPGVIASSLVRLFGGENEQQTGFCELEALTGEEDDDLIVDMQGFFFPRLFGTVDEVLAHFEEISADVAEMDARWTGTFQKLIWSHNESKKWCDEKLESTKASIEERANGGFGKRQPSDFDKEICKWLGVVPPRALTKLDLGEKKNVATPQQIVVQAAPAAGDGLERKQCQSCGELVALIDGNLPNKCRYCGADPRGLAGLVPSVEQEQQKTAAAEDALTAPKNTTGTGGTFEGSAPVKIEKRKR